ncbi:Conserved_hypothetical protein [Hexamita inflata]|uniref:FGFR1 oncogene partner (FOP) N-terminal dimerisation domain-containing protein n=1 Tax=Hexamita inflata TaxID=28002 RepID=A0AA86UF64_9EUKA|nr:Conserved hypothetical protein [Hexamita inflata]
MDEIKEMILREMKTRGYYQELQAKVRQKVEQTLCEQKSTIPPQPEKESLLLLELISEFLRYMGLNATSSTLEAEAGIQQLAMRRDFLISQVGLDPSTIQEGIPILHHMLLLCQQYGGVQAIIVEDDEE